MRKLPLFLILCAGLVGFAGQRASASDLRVDKDAPNFTLTDSRGKKHSLTDYKGKFIVLEWVNYDCPFVRKHYNSGHMQKLQKMYTEKDVVWLSICSSAEGQQGYFPPDKINALMKEKGVSSTAYLIDEDGTVGKLYGAKTTPHMYIIDPKGVLIYAGGIDDKPSTRLPDIEIAHNYVEAALDAALAGKAVPNKVAQPYGCSVKYK